MIETAISPLQLDPLTRDYWGHYDAWAVSNLALLYGSDCYTPKFYKAPASSDELMFATGPRNYATYGLKITPGSLIYGFYVPADPSTLLPPQYNVQITDKAMNHKFWKNPIPSLFLGNLKPTWQSANPLDTLGNLGSFPSLLPAPYPVTGEGLFYCEFWDTLYGTSGPGGSSQRLELVFGVLEVVPTC